MLDTYSKFTSLTFENHHPGVLEVVFDGPNLNAVDEEAHAQIPAIWSVIDQDPSVRAVLVRGAGKAFSAGGSFDFIDKQIDDYSVRMRVFRESRDLFLQHPQLLQARRVGDPRAGRRCGSGGGADGRHLHRREQRPDHRRAHPARRRGGRPREHGVAHALRHGEGEVPAPHVP